MKQDAEFAAALDGLSQSLLGSEEARELAAGIADEELAGEWEGLRRATADYEGRLRLWSDHRRDAEHERKRLIEDARLLSEAWTAAREHLGKGAGLAGKLRDEAGKLDSLAEDHASLAGVLKSVLRSFTRAAIDPSVPQPGLTHPEVAVLREKLDEEGRAKRLLADEIRRLTVELDASKLRLARLEGTKDEHDAGYVRAQAKEVIALRKERDALSARLEEQRLTLNQRFDDERSAIVKRLDEERETAVSKAAQSSAEALAKAELERDALSGRLEAAQKALEEATKTLEELQASPSQASREVARMAREVEKARRETEQERLDAESARREAESARKDSESARREVDAAKQECERFIGEIAVLREKLQQTEEALRAAKSAPPPAAPPPVVMDAELEKELKRAKAKLAKLTSELGQ